MAASDSQNDDMDGSRGDSHRAMLEAVLLRLTPSLRSFVRLRMSPALRSRLLPEDLVQSMCAEILGSLRGFEFRGEDATRAFLFTSVLNKLRERERSVRRGIRDVRREVAGDPVCDEGSTVDPRVHAQPSPSECAIAKEQEAILEQCLAELPDDQREVLILSRVARLARREIASALGRSEASVRSLLTRALASLAHALERRSR